MANESKLYVIKGEIVGIYENYTVDIDISLSDSDLERIKGLIKSSDSKDLRWVIQDEFPELYEQINDQLINATYDCFRQEYKNNYAENDDDEAEDFDINNEDYSCPIPQEWYMKCKFQVMVALTYKDKDIEVEIPLSEKEVTKIKQLVAENNNTEEEAEVDEDTYMPTPSLLTILEENDNDLFKKFWTIIMPPVFVEFLINAFDNGDIEEHEDDNFYDYHKADFDKLYEMYGDDIELEHSSCCICRIPEDWKKQ